MEISLRDHLSLLLKKSWLIAIIVVICCLTAGIYSYFYVKPVYEASTEMIVSKSNDQTTESKSNDQANAQSIDYNSVNTNIALVATYKVILKSSYIMEKLVDNYPEFNLTVEELQTKVKISSVSNTQVMTLIVSDYSYPQAVKIANAMSKVFQNEITNVMKADNVVILNRARDVSNPVPVKPNLKVNVVVSFLISLMVSVALVLLQAYLDHTLKSEDDVMKYLEVPLLASVPKIKKVRREATSKKRKVGETKGATVTN